MINTEKRKSLVVFCMSKVLQKLVSDIADINPYHVAFYLPSRVPENHADLEATHSILNTGLMVMRDRIKDNPEEVNKEDLKATELLEEYFNKAERLSYFFKKVMNINPDKKLWEELIPNIKDWSLYEECISNAELPELSKKEREDFFRVFDEDIGELRLIQVSSTFNI